MAEPKTIQTIADLRPDPDNANLGTERGLRVLDDSLRECGAGRSILADASGTVLAGNKTLERAADIGLPVRIVQTDGTELVVVQRTDLDLAGDDGQRERARRLAYLDNRSSELGLAWDATQVLADLEAGVNLEGLWRDDELTELLAGLVEPEAVADPGADVDKAEELQERWQVSDGDIWQAGDHFIACGDCREPETWQGLLAAAGVEKVNGIFTSPPYAEQRKEQYGGVPVAEYVDWWEAVQSNARAYLAGDGSFFVNIKPHCEKGERVLYVFDLVLAMKRRWGWRFVDELCWRKEGMPGLYGDRLRNDFEPVFHFAQGECRTRFETVRTPTKWLPTGSKMSNASYQGRGGNVFDGYRKAEGLALPGNVLNIHMDNFEGHPARFPVALPDFFIRAYSDPGDVWLDPFLGSGTVLVAAHQNERRGLGIEILPKYCSVVLERLSQMLLDCRKVAGV